MGHCLMALFTQDRESMVRKVERVSKYGLMVRSIMVLGRMTKLTEKEF